MNKPLRFLIVDDNPDDRTLAQLALEREFPDLQVKQIGEATCLREALEQGYFDLAITDFRLGWTDGLQVFEAIKANRPECPVIMFTATGSEEIAVKAMKLGLDDYILKSPKHFVRLAKAVRLVLERNWQRRALKEAESRFRRLFDDVPVALYRITPAGELLDANPALVHLLGYPNRQALLAINAIDSHLEPHSREEWRKQMEREGGVRDFETAMRRCDDKIIWVHHSAKAVKNDSGQVMYYEGAIEDVTERKRAEEERTQLLARERAARAEAEAANRLKDEFLATLSHELRTPLNAMLGWAKLLRNQRLDAAQTARALEVIERNALAQNQLIEDLLDVSRIIRGKMQLNVQPVDLGLVIEAALDTVRPAADAKGIQLVPLLDPTVPVSGDPDRLQQVVWNLLANAIKFTPAGGRVTVRLECDDCYVQIQVCDTGEGIRPEVIPHVFERFRQAEGTTTRSHGGLGLGLAIVRHLVELHGGSVCAESPGVGQGSTFTVQLPLPVVSWSARQNEWVSGGEKFDDDIDGLACVRVLVVEDEPDAREFITTVLEQWGAGVTAVGSVGEALVALDKESYDVLVSDIAMPEEDGYSLIRQIRGRSRELGGEIPAIALTAYAREEDRQKALSAGFQMHLSKPVEPAELASGVARLAKESHVS